MRTLVAVSVAAALALAAARTVHSQQQPLPTQVGFVDVERVMGEYRKRQALVQEIDRRKAEVAQQFKQRRAQIEANREKLSTLAEGSEEFMKLQRETDLDALAWKRDKDYEDERLLREQNQKVGLIYREVCNEIRVHAEQRGLAAVLAYDPLPQGFETRLNTLAIIQSRDVLWSDGRLDLTAQVVESLNAQLPPAPAGGQK